MPKIRRQRSPPPRVRNMCSVHHTCHKRLPYTAKRKPTVTVPPSGSRLQCWWPRPSMLALVPLAALMRGLAVREIGSHPHMPSCSVRHVPLPTCVSYLEKGAQILPCRHVLRIFATDPHSRPQAVIVLRTPGTAQVHYVTSPASQDDTRTVRPYHSTGITALRNPAPPWRRLGPSATPLSNPSSPLLRPTRAPPAAPAPTAATAAGPGPAATGPQRDLLRPQTTPHV